MQYRALGMPLHVPHSLGAGPARLGISILQFAHIRAGPYLFLRFQRLLAALLRNFWHISHRNERPRLCDISAPHFWQFLTLNYSYHRNCILCLTLRRSRRN